MREYRDQKRAAEEIFDLEQWARLFALSDIFGVRHGLIWHGLRFYYNPVTGLLEPIVFDAEAGNLIENLALNLDPEEYEFIKIISEPAFTKHYMQKLEEFSKSGYLETFFSEVGGINFISC